MTELSIPVWRADLPKKHRESTSDKENKKVKEKGQVGSKESTRPASHAKVADTGIQLSAKHSNEEYPSEPHKQKVAWKGTGKNQEKVVRSKPQSLIPAARVQTAGEKPPSPPAHSRLRESRTCYVTSPCSLPSMALEETSTVSIHYGRGVHLSISIEVAVNQWP